MELSDLFRILDYYDISATHVRRRDSIFRLRCFNADVPRAFSQLNCGVLLFKKNDAILKLFETWRDIYNRGGFRRDQIPFREALWHCEPKVYVLPPEYNQRDIIKIFSRDILTRIFHLKFLNNPTWLHRMMLNSTFAFSRHRWRAYEKKLDSAEAEGLRCKFTGLKRDR